MGSSSASRIVVFLPLLCAACQLPSVKTSQEALEVVRETLEHPYIRDRWQTDERPDLELTALAADSAAFVREERPYGFLFRDVSEVDLVREEGFPGQDRVTIELIFERQSPSGRRLADSDPRDEMVALLYAPRLVFPGRTRWQGLRFRQAVALLAGPPRQSPPPAPPAAVGPPPTEAGPADPPRLEPTTLKARLTELKECLEAGLITEEEYEAKKAQLLADF